MLGQLIADVTGSPYPDVGGHAGDGLGGAASLIIRLSSGRPSVAMTSRLIPIEPGNARLARPPA